MTSTTTTERQAGDDAAGFSIIVHDLVPIQEAGKQQTMTSTTTTETVALRDEVARSFADHMHAFHSSLPAAEQALLEQVFALAEQASSRGDDAEGYLKIDGRSASAPVPPVPPDLSAVLGFNLFGVTKHAAEAGPR